MSILHQVVLFAESSLSNSSRSSGFLASVTGVLSELSVLTTAPLSKRNLHVSKCCAPDAICKATITTIQDRSNTSICVAMFTFCDDVWLWCAYLAYCISCWQKILPNSINLYKVLKCTCMYQCIDLQIFKKNNLGVHSKYFTIK